MQPVGALNTNPVVLANGHHPHIQQQQQQSLLRNAAVVRPPVIAPAAGAGGTVVASVSGHNVQLVTQSFSLQQPQLRPNSIANQATSLAALLSTSKASASLQPTTISSPAGKVNIHLFI